MTLNSPGVEVQVIDESFYVTAAPGTRPLIIVSSQENKTNGSGTGIAVGTLKANAGKPYLITSQRDLTETFGTPLFYKDASQNPVHGGELNEYGLQAAYSYLAVSNSAYVVRSNLDVAQLAPLAVGPSANPEDGTYWFDVKDSRFGIFEWNGAAATVRGGQQFTTRVPTVIVDSTKIDQLTGAPLGSVGKVGDYAVVAITTLNKIYFKNRMGDWVLVGSDDWNNSWPLVAGNKSNPALTAGHSIIINGVEVTLTSGTTVNALASDINVLFNNGTLRGVSAAVVNSRLELYCNGAADSPQLDSSLSNAIVIEAGTGTLVASSTASSSTGIATGTYYGPALQIGPHTSVPRFKTRDPAPRPSGSVWIKTTDVNLGARWRIKIWNAQTLTWDLVEAPVYANNHDATYYLDRTGGGKNIARGNLYVQFNLTEAMKTDNYSGISPEYFMEAATFKVFRREQPDPTTITSVPITASTFVNLRTYTFNLAASVVGYQGLTTDETISFQAHHAVSDASDMAAAINAAGIADVEASVDSRNRLIIQHLKGGEIRLKDGTYSPLGLLFTPFNVVTNSGSPNFYTAPIGDELHDYIATNWKPLKYTAAFSPPNTIPDDGKLWYSSVVDSVDIMIHNGRTWVGYLFDGTYNGIPNPLLASPYYDSNVDFQTDPAGPIVSATKPKTQSDGTTLRNGDLWIDSGDIENYPALYKWDGYNLKWISVDTSDQSTEDGIIFADARYNTNGTNSNTPGDIADLLYSNFIDFDAPDPALYPRGMLLFNKRRSGFSVKRFVQNYIDIDADNIRFNSGESQEFYYPHRWVNESGNAADGRGLFGRKAQRKVVVKHMKSLVDTNQDLREREIRTFNIIACPGYTELIANMVGLNIDRKQTAFVIGDTPFRLTSDATTLNEWGSNAMLAVDNGEDGLVTYDEYLGVYYPSGYTTDNYGNEIVVPASHMVLRTIALSDGVSYPWFAPAGTRRGGITNATSIGYVDSVEGEWKSISLNEGQRDTLYAVNLNPLTFLTGSGLVIYGQKTRARNASALDRVNVARLIVYLRGQLDKLAKPYVFEPNDKITRDEIKAATESLLLELVGQRAIYDYLVVCDESNNTPSRIDRNELYLDVAIEPVKAVEFIYVPTRLKNTGEIAGIGSK